MPAPTKQADVVIIHETYGAPRNIHKAHPHKTILKYTGDVLTEVDTVMYNGETPVLRMRETLNYDGDTLASVTTKIYQRDGVTVEIQYTETLNTVAEKLDNVDVEVTI